MHSAGADPCELLRVSHVSLDYGQIEALKDVSLALFPSKVHAVVGEHGAGKSSLGMVISGSLKPSRGSIEFGSAKYPALSAGLRARSRWRLTFWGIMLPTSRSCWQSCW